LIEDPIERAGRLQVEAGELMKTIRLIESLKPYGDVVFTGSYFLDVMVYPDLDLYVPMTSIENIFAAVGQMASNARVVRVLYENEDHPSLPGGLYLNLRVNLGDFGRPWKVDIWWLDENVIQEKMNGMHHFKKLLTPELREQIIQYKNTLINSAGRTPRFSGYFVYKAFLDEGLREPAEITGYLVSNGININ
jgi:hypothetical protein